MDRNSLLYWYPRIKDLGIRTPRTEIVPLVSEEIKAYQEDGYGICLERLVKEVKIIIKSKFSLPVFLRTDQVSNKHGWKKSCYLEHFSDLMQHLFELLDFSLCANIFGGLPIEAIVIREYIPMATKFYAFYGNMPVNPERRYFIKDNKILCHHPYWIEDAIEKGHNRKLPVDWKLLLEEINTETDFELETLRIHTEKVAKVMEGFWSVDYCLSNSGFWILIDMAEGEKSWHPKECKNCPKQFSVRKEMEKFDNSIIVKKEKED